MNAMSEAFVKNLLILILKTAADLYMRGLALLNCLRRGSFGS